MCKCFSYCDIKQSLLLIKKCFNENYEKEIKTKQNFQLNEKKEKNKIIAEYKK